MKIFSHLAGYAPVNLAAAIASFGGVYVFTRLMAPEEYGVYALALWAMAMVHTFSLCWVEASGYRFAGAAEAADDLPTHYRTALSLLPRALFVGLLITAVLWFIFRDKPLYASTLPWIGVLLPVNTLVQTSLEMHKAGQRVGRYAFTATFRLLVGFALGALACLFTGLGAAAPLAGLATATALMAARELTYMIKASRGGRIDKERFKAWVAYGMPIAAALFLDQVVSGIDRPMIAALMPNGEAAVGAYAAGYGVADKTVLLICAWAAMAGSPLVMAAYERGGADAARDAARSMISTLLLLAVPAAVGLALVAEPLSEAMIGEGVREAAKQIIPWIAIAGLLNGLLIHYFSESFQLAHKTHQRALLMLVPAAVNIGLNFFLIPQFGLMGAVGSTLASYTVGILLLALIGRRHVALPVPGLDILKIGIAAGLMWPAIALMPDLGSWPELFLKAFAGGIVYVIAAFALNAGGARQFVQDKLNRG